MTKKTLYKIAGGFAAVVILTALFLNPNAAGAAITGSFALIGTVLAALSGLLG